MADDVNLVSTQHPEAMPKDNSPENQLAESDAEAGTPHNEKTGRDCNNSKKYFCTSRRLRCIEIIFAGVLVVVGISYTVFAALQWRAMRDQVAAMSLDERAWVSATGIDGIPKEGSPLTLRIVYTNTGKTPAFDVRIHARLHFFQGSVNAIDFFKAIKSVSHMEGNPMLAPMVQWSSSVTTSSNQDEIDGVAKGIDEWGAVVFGELDYRDV